MNILKLLALSGCLLILAVAFAAEAGTYTKVLGNHTVTFSTSDEPNLYGPYSGQIINNGVTVDIYYMSIGKLLPGLGAEAAVGILDSKEKKLANVHTDLDGLNEMLNSSFWNAGVPRDNITRVVPYYVDGQPAACGYAYSPVDKDILFCACYESKPGTVGDVVSIGNETRFGELAKSYHILT